MGSFLLTTGGNKQLRGTPKCQVRGAPFTVSVFHTGLSAPRSQGLRGRPPAFHGPERCPHPRTGDSTSLLQLLQRLLDQVPEKLLGACLVPGETTSGSAVRTAPSEGRRSPEAARARAHVCEGGDGAAWPGPARSAAVNTHPLPGRELPHPWLCSSEQRRQSHVFCK